MHNLNAKEKMLLAYFRNWKSLSQKSYALGLLSERFGLLSGRFGFLSGRFGFLSGRFGFLGEALWRRSPVSGIPRLRLPHLSSFYCD
jgi:hypothetical protein